LGLDLGLVGWNSFHQRRTGMVIGKTPLLAKQ
jgi:hypothetical protein